MVVVRPEPGRGVGQGRPQHRFRLAVPAQRPQYVAETSLGFEADPVHGFQIHVDGGHRVDRGARNGFGFGELPPNFNDPRQGIGEVHRVWVARPDLAPHEPTGGPAPPLGSAVGAALDRIHGAAVPGDRDVDAVLRLFHTLTGEIAAPNG